MNQLPADSCKINHANNKKIGFQKLNDQCQIICEQCFAQLKKDIHPKTFNIMKQLDSSIKFREQYINKFKDFTQKLKEKFEEELQNQLTRNNQIKQINDQLIKEGGGAFESNSDLIPQILEELNLVAELKFSYQQICDKINEPIQKFLQLGADVIQPSENLDEGKQIVDVYIINELIEQEPIQQFEQVENNQINFLLAYELFDEAQNLKNKGQFTQALSLLDQVLLIYPDYDEALYLKGFVLTKLDRNNEALESLNKCLNLNPQLGDAYLIKGITLSRNKQYFESLQALKEAEKFPYNYSDKLFVSMSTVLNDLKRYDEAIECSNIAIQFNQNCASAYNNKANSLQKQYLYVEAQKNFDRAIQLEPHNSDFIINKAVLLYDMQKFNEVINLLDQVKNIEPYNTRIYLNKYLTLRRLSRNDQALEYLDQWLQVDPNSQQAREFKSQYYDKFQ